MIAEPVELDVIRPTDAAPLSGRSMWATFAVARPPDRTEFTTVLGCGYDDVERAAYLPKVLAVNVGDTVTVAGILKVIPHPPWLVNGVRVPAWTEIRIDHARRVK